MGCISTLPQRPYTANGRVLELCSVASCRPTPPPGVKEGSRAGFIRNSPKTYRRIDSIEGHRLPLDAHMTGGEGRRPGARGGVAVVVLLAFLVLAVRYRIFNFDIFAIFGGTVYPSWDCLRRAKQARSPRPRPRAPVCPRDRSREGVVITTSRPRRRRASAVAPTGTFAFRAGNRGEN